MQKQLAPESTSSAEFTWLRTVGARSIAGGPGGAAGIKGEDTGAQCIDPSVFPKERAEGPRGAGRGRGGCGRVCEVGAGN